MFVNYTVILCYLGFLINNAITCDKMTVSTELLDSLEIDLKNVAKNLYFFVRSYVRPQNGYKLTIFLLLIRQLDVINFSSIFILMRMFLQLFLFIIY